MDESCVILAEVCDWSEMRLVRMVLMVMYLELYRGSGV